MGVKNNERFAGAGKANVNGNGLNGKLPLSTLVKLLFTFTQISLANSHHPFYQTLFIFRLLVITYKLTFKLAAKLPSKGL
jgi:hypothetical protein